LLLGAASLRLAVHLLATVDSGEAICTTATWPLGASAAGSARRPLDISGPADTAGATRATRSTRTTGAAGTTGPASASDTAGTTGAADATRATRSTGAAGAAGSCRLVRLAAELLALVGTRPVLSVLLTRCRIAVSDALAMARVMLPATAGADVGTIVVAVDVRRAVGIDVHVVARPA